MELTEQEYKKIRNDPIIKSIIDDELIPLITKSNSKRLIDNQASKKRTEAWENEWIKNGERIQSILEHDPLQSQWFGIDIIKEVLVARLTFLKRHRDWLKNRRASPKKEIFLLLMPIFYSLAEMGLGQTKQIDFIYRMYKENNYENYDTADGDQEKALRERIRKDQEAAMKLFN